MRTRKEKFAFLRELQRRGANSAEIEVAEEEARQAEQDERNSFHVIRAGKFVKIRNLCREGGRAESSAFWKCVIGVEHGSDLIDVVKTKEGLRTADCADIKSTAEEHFAGVFNAKLNADKVGDGIGEAFIDKTKEPKVKLSEESKQTLSKDFTYEELKKAINETA